MDSHSPPSSQQLQEIESYLQKEYDDESTICRTERRLCCHRCGNIRKNIIQCTECPNVYCIKCSEKMYAEFGNEVFEKGCPVCKDLCCCKDKSVDCPRTYHCYKKCPYSKSLSPPSARSRKAVDTSDSELDAEILMQRRSPQRNNPCPAVVDPTLQVNNPTTETSDKAAQGSAPKKRKYTPRSNNNKGVGNKKPKTTKIPNTIENEGDKKRNISSETAVNRNSFIGKPAQSGMYNSFPRSTLFNQPPGWSQILPKLPPISTIIGAADARAKLPIVSNEVNPQFSKLPSLFSSPNNYFMNATNSLSPTLGLDSIVELVPAFGPNFNNLMMPSTSPCRRITERTEGENGMWSQPATSLTFPTSNLNSRQHIFDTNIIENFSSTAALPNSTSVDSNDLSGGECYGINLANKGNVRDFDELTNSIPKMYDNIHDPCLEEPFSLQDAFIFEKQLRANNNGAKSYPFNDVILSPTDLGDSQLLPLQSVSQSSSSSSLNRASSKPSSS